jgi:hypothetical protein
VKAAADTKTIDYYNSMQHIKSQSAHLCWQASGEKDYEKLGIVFTSAHLDSWLKKMGGIR